jgi:hypothetical protein
MTQFAPIWNSSGVSFNAIRANVTDIASSGTSTLLDLRVNNSGVFSVDKTGAVVYGGGTNLGSTLDGKLSLTGGTLTGALNGTSANFNTSVQVGNAIISSGIVLGGWGIVLGGYNFSAYQITTTGGRCYLFNNFNVANNFGYTFSANTAGNGAEEFGLYRNGSHTLMQVGGANAQRFNLYGTYTDGSNYRRLYISSTTAGAFTLGVEGAGTGASGNTLNIGPGITIDRGGFLISVESSLILATTVLQLNSDTGQLRGRNGRIILSDNATGSTFDLLRFGGITSSFPAIKRNAAAINFRLADDSADAAITAGNGTFSGALSAVTKSFLIDHPTQPGKKLQYGSLESPYHGIRLTGRAQLVNGSCVVELPGYVSALVHDDINIQLTPVGRNVVWVEGHDLESNTFTARGDQDGMFYWSFTAVRKDIEPLEVEPWA